MSKKGMQPKIIENKWPETTNTSILSGLKQLNVVKIDGVLVDQDEKSQVKSSFKESPLPSLYKKQSQPVRFSEPMFNASDQIQREKTLHHPSMFAKGQSIDDIMETDEESESQEEDDDGEDEEVADIQAGLSQKDIVPGSLMESSKQFVSKQAKFEQKREKSRTENSLKAFLTVDNALGYINKLKFDVQLGELYTVIDSCSYNSENFWCPVLLKVGEMMQESNFQKDSKKQKFQMKEMLKQYLLQIWDKKGRMVYERQLDKPVRDWGIFDDVFIFVEEDHPKQVQVVKLRREEPATLFTLKLKMKRLEGKPSNKHNNQVKSCSIDSQFVAYTCGYVLYGTPRTIHYMEIDSIIQEHDDSKWYMQEIICDFGEHQEKNIISNFKVSSNFVFKGFIDAGENFTAMLMEDTIGNDLSFIRITKIHEDIGVEMQTCGIDDETRNQVQSPIQDLRSVITRDKDGQYVHSAVALRKNGRIDFYSDFCLVDQSLPQDMFTDIEADFKQFYIRRHRNNAEIEADREKDSKEIFAWRLYKVALHWKNRIGMTSKLAFQPKEGKDRWKLVVHYRVSNYLKLYSCFLCYSTYFLVSHRNFVSVFDLKTNKWQQNIEFDDFVQCLALCRSSSKKQHDITSSKHVEQKLNRTQTEKLDKDHMQDDFAIENNSLSNVGTNVAVVVGNSQINQIKENKTGKKQMLRKSEKAIPIGGRALSWLDDQKCNTGLYFIVDDLPNHLKIVELRKRDAFYTYESEMNNDKGNCKVIAYTKGRMSPLLVDNDDLKKKSQMAIFPGITQDTLGVNSLAIDEVKSVSKLMITTYFDVEKSDDGNDVVQDATCQMYSVIEADSRSLKLKEINGEIEVEDFIKVPAANKLVGGAVVQDPHYKDKQYFTIQVTDVGINIFDRSHTLYAKYNNCNIKHILFSDDSFMYCLADAVNSPISKTDDQDNENPIFKECKETSGLYCYDLSRLVNEDRIEYHKLASALVGVNSNLSYSEFNQRISFCKDFTTMEIMPFAHRNTINFLGMGVRQDYLIWREKNGFFTCLSTRGILRTWSVASGKLLYRDKHKYNPEELCNYVIYQAAKLQDGVEDSSQLMNFYNYPDRSLSIIRKKKFDHKLGGKLLDISEMVSSVIRDRSQTLRGPEQKINKYFDKRSSEGTRVKLQETKHKMGVFNFKVLELKTVDDFKENNERENCDRLRELFNFDFPIVLPHKNSEKGKQFHTHDTQQRLYLSRDTNRLMEVIDNRMAVIYDREKNVKLGSKITWKRQATINQFPTVMQGNNSANFLFSPNFDRYIDIIFSSKQFAIREVEWFIDGVPPIKEKEVQKCDLIPKDIISFKGYGDKDPKEIVKYLASQIMFVTDHVIRIITQNGIDCLFDVEKRNHEIQQGIFDYRLLSFTKLDNYKIKAGTFNVENHSILERLPLQIDDVFVRLVRKNHVQKAWLDQCDYLDKSTVNQELEIKKISKLNSVDYNLNTGGESNAFIAELSFTVLDWIILDKIQGNKPFTLRDIDGEQQLQLCFNIFPGGKTILHKLAREAQADTEGGADDDGTYNTQQAVKDLFEIAKRGVNYDCQYFDENEALEIPIIEDMNGNTAIDLAMGQTEKTELDIMIEELMSDKKEKVLEANIQMAMGLFECIKGYSTLHSSPYLIEAITKAIKYNLPGIGDYLDARIRKYEGINISTMQRQIQKGKINSISGYNKYGVFSMDIVGNTKRVKAGLFKKHGPEKQMTFEVFDIPQLYQQTAFGAKFVQALGQSDDIELFSHIAVQKIINYHWKDTSKYVYGFLFFPMCLQMAIFTNWHVSFLDELENPDYYNRLSVSRWLLVGMSAYFIILELIQASRNWRNYFSCWSNLFDMAPNFMILINTYLVTKLPEIDGKVMNEDEELVDFYPYKQTFWKIQAFSGLLLWLKFILFLRVFDTTSFLINMIKEVITALTPFMIVLGFSILGFTDAFYSLNQSYNKRIVEMETYSKTFFYSILNTFGEFAVEELDWTGKLFFLLASFVNLIILLNLVIAIISEIFTTVNNVRMQAFYMERAALIADLWTIIPPFAPETDAKSRLLFFATEVSVTQIRKQVQDQKLQEEEDQKNEQIVMTQAMHHMIKSKLEQQKGTALHANTGQESTISLQDSHIDPHGRRRSIRLREMPSTFDSNPDKGRRRSIRMREMPSTSDSNPDIMHLMMKMDSKQDNLSRDIDNIARKLKSIVKKVNKLTENDDEPLNRTIQPRMNNLI